MRRQHNPHSSEHVFSSDEIEVHLHLPGDTSPDVRRELIERLFGLYAELGIDGAVIYQEIPE